MSTNSNQQPTCTVFCFPLLLGIDWHKQDQQEGVHDFRDHIDPDHHGPKVVEHESDARPSYDRPYLILDVRPPEDYRGCRIVQVGVRGVCTYVRVYTVRTCV